MTRSRDRPSDAQHGAVAAELQAARTNVAIRLRRFFEDEGRCVRLVAAIFFLAQLAFLLSNSTLEMARNTLTADAQYNIQSVYLMGRGITNPQIFGGSSHLHYFDDHAEYIMHVLGFFSRFVSTIPLLKYTQDASLVAASVFAWTIAARVCDRAASARERWALRLTALCLLVLDPWTYRIALFDFHEQIVALPFLLGGLAAATTGRTGLALVAFAIVIGFGDVTATWIFGMGLSLALRRELRVFGLAVSGVALVVFEIFSRIKATETNVAGLGLFYGYVLDPGEDPTKATIGPIVHGALRHPERVLERVWGQALNIWANVAPTGIAGLFHPFALGTSLLNLAESSMTGSEGFANPGFQNAPIYALGGLGTTLLLAAVVRRHPRLGLALCAAAALNVAAWGAAFLPITRSHWIRASAAEGAEVAAVLRSIPQSRQVLISQGFVGAAAARRNVFLSTPQFGLFAHEPIDVVVTPYSGIEMETTDDFATQLKFWVFDAHARLVSHKQNVWHFAVPAWPPAGLDARAIRAGLSPAPDESATFPAWSARIGAGRMMLGRTSAESFVRSTGERGFVVSGTALYLRPGEYRITARIRADGPLVLEAYDPYRRRFIARVPVRIAPSVRSNEVDVDLAPEHEDPRDLEAGWGLLQYKPELFHAGADKVELRIFNPGGTHADVYDYAIAPLATKTLATR